jgi:hypothetical protein
MPYSDPSVLESYALSLKVTLCPLPFVLLMNLNLVSR